MSKQILKTSHSLKMKEFQEKKLYLKEISEKNLEILLKFIYSDHLFLDKFDEKELLELMKDSDYLQINIDDELISVEFLSN